MRINEHTPKVLKLQVKDWFDCCAHISVFIIVVLTGIAAIFGATFEPQATLECHHASALSVGPVSTQVVCKLTKSSLWSQNVTTLEQLQGAEVDASGDQYRVVLIADNTRIPLTPGYISGTDDVFHHAASIRAFIHNSGEPSLKIHEDYRWHICLVGGLFIFFGVFWLFPKSLVSCVFDKNSGQLYLERQNLLFQSEIREANLDNVKIIQVDEKINNKGKKIRTAKIVLKSGSPISLGFLNNTNAVEVIKTINQFLSKDVSQQA